MPTRYAPTSPGFPATRPISAVQQLLIKHIAGVVGTVPAKIAVHRPLIDLGMDSLMLVELRIGLDKQFGIAFPTLELMDLATVEKLGRRIVDDFGSAPAVGGPSPAVEEPVGGLNAIADADEPAFELTLGRLAWSKNSIEEPKERPL